MNDKIELKHLQQHIPDFYIPDEIQIKLLRKIIREESGHKFTYEETKDVAYQLIRLYECLITVAPEGVAGGRHGRSCS